MTMTNAEWMIKNGYKFSDVCLAGSDDTIAISLNGKSLGKVPGYAYFAAFREWLDMEHKDPILDDAEKRYLKGVIRPFRDKVDFICKVNFLEDAFQHIVIGITNDEGIALPTFKSRTMYKGMKPGHGYTLEKLGL